MFRRVRAAWRFAVPLIASLSLAACGGGGGTSGGNGVLAAGPLRGTTAALAQSVACAGSMTSSVRLAAALGTQPASAADAFVDSVGVNVHLHYTGTPYVNAFPTLRAMLVASGVRHVRDGLIDTTWLPYYQHLGDLAASGIHADVITSVTQSASLIAGYASRVPGVIEAFEAPNEYPVGQTGGAATLAAFTRTLYAAVHGNAATAGCPVIGPSLTSSSQYAAVGDLSTSLDFGNMHDYFAGRNPGTYGWGGRDAFGVYGSLLWNIGIARQTDPLKPLYATETGYMDAAASQNSVPPAVKARYTLRTLLEHWNAGVARTYIYQLVDEGTNTGTYGLIDATLHPKPAYTALTTLLRHLADPGPAYAPASLAMSIEAPTAVHRLLLGRRDGSYALALWVEAAGYDVNAKTPIAVARQTATLRFAQTPRSVASGAIDDAGTLVSAVQTPAADGSVLLSIDDHVTIVDLRP